MFNTITIGAETVVTFAGITNGLFIAAGPAMARPRWMESRKAYGTHGMDLKSREQTLEGGHQCQQRCIRKLANLQAQKYR